MKRFLVIAGLAAVVLALTVWGGVLWKSRAHRDPVPAVDVGMAIKEFDWGQSGSSVDQIYDYVIRRNEDDPSKYTVIYVLNAGYEVYSVPASAQLVQEVTELVTEYELWEWNGFSESDPFILDGYGFSLSIVYADGTKVWAHGSNAYPSNYSKVSERVEVLFRQYREENERNLTDITDEWEW